MKPSVQNTSRDRQNPTALTSTSTFKKLLAIGLSLMAVSCSSGGGSSQQTVSNTTAVSDTTEVSAAISTLQPEGKAVKNVVSNRSPVPQPKRPSADTAQNPSIEEGRNSIEALEARLEQMNLQPGTPYGLVRSRLIEEGWEPNTLSTGVDAYSRDSILKTMWGLGFDEATSCSGTGQGFCSFGFMYPGNTRDTRIGLRITTTPYMGPKIHQEPRFYARSEAYHFNIRDLKTPSGSDPKAVAEARERFHLLEADSTFQDRNFRGFLYEAVCKQESAELATGNCGDMRYLFRDVLMVASTDGDSLNEVSLTFHEPISRTMALAYALMLDTEDVIDFEKSVVEENDESNLPETAFTETFFEGSPTAGIAPGLNSVTSMQLFSPEPNRQISKILFTTIRF